MWFLHCLLHSARAALFCVSQGEEGKKNAALKSRLYWEWFYWRLVIATSELLNTFPLEECLYILKSLGFNGFRITQADVR